MSDAGVATRPVAGLGRGTGEEGGGLPVVGIALCDGFEGLRREVWIAGVEGGFTGEFREYGVAWMILEEELVRGERLVITLCREGFACGVELALLLWRESRENTLTGFDVLLWWGGRGLGSGWYGSTDGQGEDDVEGNYGSHCVCVLGAREGCASLAEAAADAV